MGEIRTVLGPVVPEQLGFTDTHCHLIMDRDYIIKLYPDFALDSIEKSCRETHLFMKAGGQALVEMSPIGAGRNIQALIDISRATGIHVVACTGLHKDVYYLDTHWRSFYTVEQMAQIFIEEIELGIDANNYSGPFLDRSTARAGVIKVATEYQFISPREEQIIHAAALAHLQTGAPISTHTENGTMGLEQVKRLMSFGVDPQHIIVGHLDRNPDFYTHREIAETGAYLCYDTPSRIKYFPETQVLTLIRQMVDAGFGKQLLWGSDLVRRSYLVTYGGGPGLAYVPGSFVTRMRKEGFEEEVINDIFIGNPARALTIASVS